MVRWFPVVIAWRIGRVYLFQQLNRKTDGNTRILVVYVLHSALRELFGTGFPKNYPADRQLRHRVECELGSDRSCKFFNAYFWPMRLWHTCDYLRTNSHWCPREKNWTASFRRPRKKTDTDIEFE